VYYIGPRSLISDFFTSSIDCNRVDKSLLFTPSSFTKHSFYAIETPKQVSVLETVDVSIVSRIWQPCGSALSGNPADWHHLATLRIGIIWQPCGSASKRSTPEYFLVDGKRPSSHSFAVIGVGSSQWGSIKIATETLRTE
jgi:hypothetical protein